jgi:DNA-binding transcriptional LysR family regulator
MDTKWLEDFHSLVETRSFSRAAQLRHVTQPAFSRRIHALEAWELTVGVRLVRERPLSACAVRPGAAALWEPLARR